MNRKSIDINADVGEGLNNERELMPFLSSCNIACGGHAGDAQTMLSVIALAKQNKVKIGAHPSFPDTENFGRVPMDLDDTTLLKSLINQVQELLKHVEAENENLDHIKPHGALYNLANTDERYAKVVVDLMKQFDNTIKLYAPYQSRVAELAIQEGIPVVLEAFADRAYNENLTLVSRSDTRALLTDSNQVCQQVLDMVLRKEVKTITGKTVTLKAETVCIHGDHPNAESHLKQLTECLTQNHVAIV
ncbi:5-oxoprolinase subunit PxpA [Gelidibacter salicanalis]|uniref:5-oxoprolinase subunit PxpA n=1 Tax=Gelidibacter salicanalis TaxID=291193 RepID=A0A5C7AT75_9FLAO|nr:5-oxoprolinase subunit PxpA [Gelidibacter salicanalis]TXE10829.1 5-oxoprolinase subunit PxpA [Gelidibacter salicanalis]